MTTQQQEQNQPDGVPAEAVIAHLGRRIGDLETALAVANLSLAQARAALAAQRSAPTAEEPTG